MSGSDTVEDMEVCSEEPSTSKDVCVEIKHKVQHFTLSVKWPEGDQPQKSNVELQKVLQTWANNLAKEGNVDLDCSVLKVSENGRALIRIKPAPAVKELLGLSGQTLKGKDGKTVTITSVSLTPLELETQKPEDAALNLPPSSVAEPKAEQMQLMEKRSISNSAAVSTAEEEIDPCRVPVGHFWYVSHIFKEEIKHIEKKNGVKMDAEVYVSFEADQKDGDPQKAFSEFTNLVQKCFGEIDGSVFPLKNVDPEELKNTLKIIQRKENKLLLTLSSEEMSICGPRQSQDTISKSLNATQKTLTNTVTSAGESTWASHDTSLNIGMSIKDPLVDTGITMEESCWKLMTTSLYEQVAKIKAKFGVDFTESAISQGRVKVKVHYTMSGGNASMESHAARALLNLYQKIATSPMNFTQVHGAMGFSGSPKNLSNVYESKGASSGLALNGQSGYSTGNTEAPTGGGATARDNKDEYCPICMDTFTNKTQLKCKHEFCEECLALSKKSIGPICPVCKDVFGMLQGDQPDGAMSWHFTFTSLPGYQNCPTIVITYNIPSGKQTERHPNPGEYYTGINRTAYLPDNKEGRQVLCLLKKAFDMKLIFTVGTSRTTGKDNQVTWNDIHHKTSMSGGAACFGYPDPGYLDRVREELMVKGIK